MNQTSANTAVVLSGGGAYGAFGVGIMKVLFAGKSPATGYKPLDPAIFTGTSVGAFNAAFIGSQFTESSLNATLRLEDVWFDQIAERPGKCGSGVFRLRGDWLSYLEPNPALRIPYCGSIPRCGTPS